mgnify:FL=1
MITFGYKNKFSGVLRALAAIAIGLVMVFSTEATTNVVKIIAAFLFAAGLVSFAYGLAHKKDGVLNLMVINAGVDIVIGILLFIFPGAIANIIVTLIGIVIFIFGLIQIFALAGTASLLGSGIFSFILSGVALVGAAILIFNPFTERVMSILAGIFLICYGVNDLISTYRVSKAQKEYEIHFSSTESQDQSDMDGFGDVKDVDYKKIDEQ